ncbi:PilN domain-containing protein [Aquisalimonas sp. 2447]|uniref:PilN domain-containing protein n=1 Tax=Aquisalimonas sp. 2447 TaxID=2740807 RepID=UPI0014327A97|nr:PilN domain-containing protein [Aquisalimonas sp. 2447]QIT55558.1 PilN domain-containing protein [Aquisalimonas sp. 2447]
MRQEVNLYQPVRRNRDWLSLAALPLWAGGLALALALFSGWYWQQVADSERRAERLTQQVQEEREAVEALRAEAPPEDPDPALQRRVQSLEDEITARQRLGDRVVATDDAPWRGGFASVFQGLAREAADDVWLERIRARADGGLRLEGGAMRAAAVPEFVDHLGREPEFIGRSFAGLELRRPEDNERPLRFVLRGAGGGDD